MHPRPKNYTMTAQKITHLCAAAIAAECTSESANQGGIVEIVVGVTQGASSRDALALSVALANALDADIVVTNVFPVAYNYVSPAHVDAEWQAFLVEQADEALAWARDELGDRDRVSYVMSAHRSSGVGLAEVATKRHAQLIVIGSAPGGSEGRIAGGSTSDQLLHGSPVPVALAPHGYADWAPSEILRANVAYQQTRESDHCLEVTVEALRRRGHDVASKLQLVTVVERVTRIYGSRLGRHAEDQVLFTLREQAEAALAAAVARVQAETGAASEISTVILEGENVTNALARRDWDDADILVTGSTGAGPIRRVFLGDMAYKIIKASTIPVMVIPRSASLEELST